MNNIKDFSMIDLIAEVSNKLSLIEQRLTKIEARLNESSPSALKEVLNAEETSQYLKISASHLYKLTCTSQIPHYKPTGKKLYFKRTELDNYLIRNRVSSKDEIEQMANEYIMKHPRK